jgi:hypothetical protein
MIRRFFVVCVIASAWSMCSAAAGWAQSGAPGAPLRWRFDAGRTLRYRLTHRGASRVELPERSVEQDDLVALDLTWRVAEVRDDGSASIRQTVDRVRVELRTGERTTRYDSEEGVAEGDGAVILQEVYGRLMAAPVEWTMRPDGTMGARLNERAGAEFGGGPIFIDSGSVATEAGLGRILEQALPPLPGMDVAVGEEWSKTFRPAEIPPLRIVTTARARYAAREQDVARIDASLETEIGPSRNGGLGIEVNSQSGEQHAWFDCEQGTLISARSERVLDLTYLNAGARVRQRARVVVEFARIHDGAAP